MKLFPLEKLIIILLPLTFISFQWPLENYKITSVFGESRGDHFHDGVDMVSANKKIFPVKKGALSYYWDKMNFPLENYPGGGNYAVVQHSPSLFSIYMHLKDGISKKKIFTTKDNIGKYANTGHSYGNHLHFTIFDKNQNATINPLILLKGYTDQKKPEIKNIYIRLKKKYYRIRNKSKIRLTQHYPLLIHISDSIKKREKVGIYTLKVYINNALKQRVAFKKIKTKSIGLSVGKSTFESIFDNKGFYKVNNPQYKNGENIIKVDASDLAGNKTSKIFKFTVKLDLKNSLKK